MPVSLKCEACSSVFVVPPSRAGRRACSRRCAGVLRSRDAAAQAAERLAFGEKWCPRCEATRPLGDFTQDRTRLDRKSAYCRPCQSALGSESYRQNRGKRLASNRRWVRANRERRRQTQKEYYRRTREEALKRARENYDRDSHRTYLRSWRRGSRARVVAIQASYRARKRLAIGKHTGKDLVRLWHRQRGECARCGVRFGKRPSDGGYQVDHVTPLSRGGSNWPRNLQLLCGPDGNSCNQRKRDKTPAEFTLYLRRALGES